MVTGTTVVGNAITGNVVTANTVNSNVVTANIYQSADWSFTVTTGANLLFQYLGANVMSIDSGGNVVIAGTLTQNGAPN